jgi:hypothetical protein
MRRKQAAAAGCAGLGHDMKFNGHSGDCSNATVIIG